MSVSTIGEYAGHGIGSRVAAFFSGIYASMIRAREAQGRRYVAQHLSRFDDRTLERAGFKCENLMNRPRDLAIF